MRTNRKKQTALHRTSRSQTPGIRLASAAAGLLLASLATLFVLAPDHAFAQCASAPAPVSLAAGACEDNGVTRQSNVANTPAVRVTGGTYTGNSVTLQTTLGGTAGAQASQTGQIILNGASVTILGTNSYGLEATDGGTLNAYDFTVSASGDESQGAFSRDAGSTMILERGSITTTGASAIAVWSTDGASLTGTSLSIRTEGGAIGFAGSYGALVEKASSLTLTNSSIVTLGDRGAGIYALDNGSIFNGSGLNIQTSGVAGHGVVAGNGAQITLSNSDIRTSANTDAIGVWAFGGSQVTLSNVNVSTAGTLSEGLFAWNAGSRIDATGGTISTQGDDSYGITAVDGATAIGRNLSVTTTGNLSRGAYASMGGVLTLENSTITTTGANADGLRARNGGSLTATNVDVSVSGLSSAAIYMDGGTLADPNQITVNGGSLAASQGAIIHVVGDTGSVTLNGPVAITSGIVNGQRQFVSVEANGLTPSALSLDVNDVSGIEGAFSVEGAGHVVNASFTGRSDWSGDLLVDPGNTVNLSLANSIWTGLSSGTPDITLDAGSRWNVTGSSNAGTITNAGHIVFVPNTGTFSTLTVNNFVGQNGVLGLNTHLGDDASPSDVLVIDGGAASGTTGIAITNAGGTGEQTTGDGIRIVQAVNGATTAADAFHLSGRIAAGVYEYLLFRGGTTSNEDWFLRSFRIEDETPLYRPEVALYAPVPALVRAMDLALIGTLHERVGEQAQGANDEASWARVIGEYGDGRWSGTVGARATRSRIVGLQSGLDLYRSRDDDGGQDRLGVYVGYAIQSTDLNGFALGRHDLPVGSVDLRGKTAGAYWTHYTSSGGYLDAVIQGNWFDVTARSDYDTGMKTSGASYTASLEAGQAIALTGNWQIEPQAQIIAQTLSLDDSRDDFSPVRWQEDDTLTGRIGLRLHYTERTAEGFWQPYLKANLWRGLSGTDYVVMESDAIDNRFGHVSPEIGVGFTSQLSATTSLYGHVDHRWSTTGQEKQSLTSATLGLRFSL